MTTDPTPRTRPATGLYLDDGPLGEALQAIDLALAGIETAKATLTARRHDFARVFRDEVVAHAEDPRLADDLAAVIRALYWEYPTLRLADLSAATGLDNERIRRLAGPRVVEAACLGCGTPTEVLQTRRSERREGRCPDCRQPAFDPFTSPPTWGPPPRPDLPAPPDVDWLDRLLAHLDARLRSVECDHQLTLTQRWALREGLDQDTVASRVRAFGGFCDCEVVANAPPTAGPGPASW